VLQRNSPVDWRADRREHSRWSKNSPVSYTADGVAGADALLADAGVGLFDTEDARGGIRSFLASGPGHATFAGQ
jgi:hypothetical protein